MVSALLAESFVQNKVDSLALSWVPCSEISADPEERRDLGLEPAHQQRVQHMLRAVVAERATAYNPHRGTADPRACEKATGEYNGFWGPFEM
jgi:hypothetical protein